MTSFIVFEGITGSGKKTQIKNLAARLTEKGKIVTSLSFPNFETDIAKVTRRGTFDPFTLALLYAADRSQYQERIKALLDKGEIVISDRYCYSNFAYQSAKGVPLDWLMNLEKNIIKPNLVFFIDVPIETSIGRVQQANIEDFTKKELIDRLKTEREVQEKIRGMYLYLAKNNPDRETNWFVIDGTKELNQIQDEIWNAVKDQMGIQ
jgi:dTMP kinase